MGAALTAQAGAETHLPKDRVAVVGETSYSSRLLASLDVIAEFGRGPHFRMRRFRKVVCTPTFHVAPDLVSAPLQHR